MILCHGLCCFCCLAKCFCANNKRRLCGLALCCAILLTMMVLVGSLLFTGGSFDKYHVLRTGYKIYKKTRGDKAHKSFFDHFLFSDHAQTNKMLMLSQVAMSSEFLDKTISPCSANAQYSDYICGNYPFEWYNSIKTVSTKMKMFKDRVDDEIRMNYKMGNIRGANRGMKLNKFYESCKMAKNNITLPIQLRTSDIITRINKYNKNSHITDLLVDISDYGYQSLLSLSFEYTRFKKKYFYSTNQRYGDVLIAELKSSFPTDYLDHNSKLSEMASKTINKYDKSYDHEMSVKIYNALLVGYLKSFKYESVVTLDETSDNFFYSHIDMIKFMEMTVGSVMKQKITGKTIIKTKILSFLLILDIKLGKLNIKTIKDFLKLYCVLGEISKTKIINLSEAQPNKALNHVEKPNDQCIHMIHKLFPLTYCKYIKEFIGTPLNKAISTIEELTSYTIQEFKSMLIESKFDHFFKESIQNRTVIKNVLDSINSLYINVGKCHSRQWETSLGHIINNHQDLITIENSFDVSNDNFELNMNNIMNRMKISSGETVSTSKLFKIHRKDLFRNHFFSLPDVGYTDGSESGTRRLYNIIDESSPRYNIESHEIIFPLQMLLSPIVNNKYSFEDQTGFYSFFIAHELSHVLQRSIYDDSNTPTQSYMENQADTIATDVSISLLKKFGIKIKKSTFESIFQFWCKKNKNKNKIPHTDVHLIGNSRIDHAINTMSKWSKKEFKHVYKCE